MVVSPMLRGLLGIDASVTSKRLTVSPHLPGDWTWWKARNVRIGNATVDLAYDYADGAMTLDASAKDASGMALQFSPSISPRARVLGVTVNGRAAKFDVQKNAGDQHVTVDVPLSEAKTSVRIRVQDDFALSISQGLPELGLASRNVKIVSESWTADAVTYDLAGISGMTYEFTVRGVIASVEGAELSKDGKMLRVTIPSGETGYRHAQMTVRFSKSR